MIVFCRLWETMGKKGISPDLLRDEYGFDNETLYMIKANKDVDYETINKICEVLGCDINDIMEYIPD